MLDVPKSSGMELGRPRPPRFRCLFGSRVAPLDTRSAAPGTGTGNLLGLAAAELLTASAKLMTCRRRLSCRPQDKELPDHELRKALDRTSRENLQVRPLSKDQWCTLGEQGENRRGAGQPGAARAIEAPKEQTCSLMDRRMRRSVASKTRTFVAQRP